MKRVSRIIISLLLALLVVSGFCTYSKADNIYTVVDTTADLYVKAGTKYYNVPSEVGEVLFTSFADGNVPVNGVCVENGWYRISLNGAPAYINQKDVYTKQDAYIGKTVGMKNANKKLAKVLSDGTKLYTIGVGTNGMPIYSVFPDIAAPEYFIAAILATGVEASDDDFTKIKKVRSYVSSHIIYDRSCMYKYGTTYDTLMQGRAVCYGYAQTAQTLLLAVGVDAYHISGKMPSGLNHAWCGVNVDGVRYSFEPQGNSEVYPLVQGNDAGLGYIYSSEDRFSMIEKITSAQKNLIDLAFAKWR